MKKIVLIMGISLMATGAFASNEIKKNEQVAEETVEKVCCRRGATNSDGENVTIRACVDSTGDAQIDMGNACEKAKAHVLEALKDL